MTPKVKIFEKVFRHSSVRHGFTFRGQKPPNFVKIGSCEVAEKSSGLPHKKIRFLGTRPIERPILPKMRLSRPKFPERCRPLTCPCVPTFLLWVALSCTIFEIFDVEEYRDLEFWVNGYRPCEFLDDLYIAELYRPGATFLPLLVWVYLRLHFLAST